MSLEGRVAIVTGSGRGIGRAVALALARDGARLVINDVGDPAPAQAVVAEIEALGSSAVVVLGDISQSTEVSALVERTVEHFGQVDILVNNAGIARDNLLLRMSDSEWDQVLNINLKGAFLCTRAVLKYMLRQKWGRIINISSVVGIMGNAGQANYAAAKAGLLGLTRSAAKEMASRGITVNAVAPGFIDTGMTRALADKVQQQALGQIPVGRFGTPDDVAHAVAFLAAPESAYITGQVVQVNGGLVM